MPAGIRRDELVAKARRAERAAHGFHPQAFSAATDGPFDLG
jgi:hypothetical protein